MRATTRRRRVLTAGALIAVVLSLTSISSASASPRPVVAKVKGIELVAEHTKGTFAGYTTGGLTAGWAAVVDHTPLDPGARITGGSFTLVTRTRGFDHPITAAITGGTITVKNRGGNCTNQTYDVTGAISRLPGKRSGSFRLTLTHWRHRILGSCLAYFATTTGTLVLAR